jgi:O-antigen/teichoic acid export membrane protein
VSSEFDRLPPNAASTHAAASVSPMDLKRWSAKLAGGGFARAVAVLAGGAALGHAITAMSMPVLTRLYTPADFGVLAVFTAVFAVVAVAACLRYEIAIALPASDVEAANLLIISTICAAAVSLLLAAVVLTWAQPLSAWLGTPAIAAYLWLLPLCTLLAGVFAALQGWLVRQRRFATLARTRVAQSAAAAGTQIAVGAAVTGPFGLVLGPVVNGAAGSIAGLLQCLRASGGPTIKVDATSLRRTARKYSSFALFSTPEALANSAAIQLPIMLIAALGSGAEAGHLMLAMFVVQAPMSLLGTAVAQVFLAHAPQELRVGRLAAFTADTVGGLMRTGVGPLLCLGLIAPLAFPLVFGDGWQRAGVVTAWLAPWFAVQFLCTPVSMVLHVTQRQRLALLAQLGGLALRSGAVVGAALAWDGGLTEAYAVSGVLFYSMYLVAIAHAAGCPLRDFATHALRAAPAVAAWVTLGAAVAAAGWLWSWSA